MTFQFHPAVSQWFDQKFGSPTEPQQRGWPPIQAKEHTLIAAPTGSGKTLAAFFASLDELFREGLAQELPDETRVLYVSPLKALSNDIRKNLEEPLAGLRAALLASEGRDIEVRAEVRTGDTPAAKRQAIVRRPPHILVTTPESFYLLLTSESGRKLLAPVRALIVDEIHALVGNRRGSHLALSMERLARLTQRPFQRIGLSATQKPIEEVARFLVGANSGRENRDLRCTIVDMGRQRDISLEIELPGSALESVMSNEVWAEVYDRLATLIQAHRTTLVFVNTRRLAERVTHELSGRVGKDKVDAHHGSLSAKLRLDAENKLKRGELKALVATASLELGIDIGSVDLVCQVGSPRSIATLLQRVGRASHHRGGLPKGRIFPLSRDELVECLAAIQCVRAGELDCFHMPRKPLDLLAQQMVACAATQEWKEEDLFDLTRSAYPYRDLTREEFDEVLGMLAEGFSTKRGRRGALLHHDAINGRVRARRGARLIALTSGGAIADNADYRVMLEPTQTLVGTINEDFAVESMAGDIFQLGNTSWRILGVNSGTVRVEDAQGQPPGIPFWLGEAPGRTDELSVAVSDLRERIEGHLGPQCEEWLIAETGVSAAGARQLAEYFGAAHRALGTIPSRKKLVLERFFDESGGMQIVLHSLFGIRINRAWGLALRKRFCRSFNFELQAAATDDALVLSLGAQHSFPLEEVFRYLNSKTVRELLIQALLDAPMFTVRWRWNAARSLALPRYRNGHKVPAPLQRMEAENLLAAVFPDQLACLENIAGDRDVPSHPLVRQTIEDCLSEAMDVEGLIEVLRAIESGRVECLALDLPEPSPLAHEILHARPYAFLDDAPLEERRTQAVYTRRSSQAAAEGALGALDASAIEKVRQEAWPRALNADELHDALLLMGAMNESEILRISPLAPVWLEDLARQGRAGFLIEPHFCVAAERLPRLQAIYPGCQTRPLLAPPEHERKRLWERDEALRELVRGRMEVLGPVTAGALAQLLRLPCAHFHSALLALEGVGFILRGKFTPGAAELEWCDRRLLARIHRLTIHRLRSEVKPVSVVEFLRFLLAWQGVDEAHQREGISGLQAVLESLDGCELPAGAWEPEVLALRVKDYNPQWLDQLCFTGRIGWGRLTPPQNGLGRSIIPVRSSPISLFGRESLRHWSRLSPCASPSADFSPDTQRVRESLSRGGALFFGELVSQTGLLPSRVEEALARLVGHGLVTADSFEGLRALLLPLDKRLALHGSQQRRRHKAVTSVEFAGRWSLLRKEGSARERDDKEGNSDEAVEFFARALLRRYGIVFRKLLERELFKVSWFELSRVLRRLEARGEIRGGYFVEGISGEQFALSEAIGLLRSTRKMAARGDLVVISGADPLNLAGIVTPGRRLAAFATNRLALRDGCPLAALEAGAVILLGPDESVAAQVERALRIGTMPPALRRYYA